MVNLTNECVARQNEDTAITLTSFTLERTELGVDIRIAGCMKIKRSADPRPHVLGTVDHDGRCYKIMDNHLLKGLEPRTITGNSCIVFLKEGPRPGKNGYAIVVDDVTEMLTIANGNLKSEDAIKKYYSPDAINC